MTEKTALVTGGAGFIGSNLIRLMIRETDWRIVNVDCLTYAGNRASLADLDGNPRYEFCQTDIRDVNALREIFEREEPSKVIHLAAESHVDRSIDAPDVFLQTNVMGTLNLLRCTQELLERTDDPDALFVHVSTDEVFGSASPNEFFQANTPYRPSSPYSASKAASDHLVRSWHETFGVPTCITNCSNNYGPFQFPEKLIPFMVLSGLAGRSLPVYGDGRNVRDWLFVEDHCEAIRCAAERGAPGETYLIGGDAPLENIQVIQKLCGILDESNPDGAPHDRLIKFVKDRPGHDRRYAVDAQSAKTGLGWAPRMAFTNGLRHTVDWYLNNEAWWRPLLKDDSGLSAFRFGKRGTND